MNKYHARRTEVDGLRFDSQAEARRYGELRLLEAAGLISRLECQPRFPLVVNGVRVGEYRADFRYWSEESAAYVVEDIKGGEATRTPVYKLKKKLVAALYGVEVVEVQA